MGCVCVCVPAAPEQLAWSSESTASRAVVPWVREWLIPGPVRILLEPCTTRQQAAREQRAGARSSAAVQSNKDDGLWRGRRAVQTAVSPSVHGWRAWVRVIDHQADVWAVFRRNASRASSLRVDGRRPRRQGPGASPPVDGLSSGRGPIGGAPRLVAR